MKLILVSFIIYSVLGTILHFTYNLFNKSVIVGIISSVNESTWEHAKILMTPIFLYNTVLYIMKYQKNYFFSLFVQLLVAIIGIILLYRLKKKIFKNRMPILNILIFYITAFLCSCSLYITKVIYIPRIINLISVFLVIIIYLMYMTFTVCPPKRKLFLDPISKTYGINCK